MPATIRLRPRIRTTAVVVAVLALHLLALWALQSGLPERVREVFVPVQVISALVEPPRPATPRPQPPPAAAAVRPPPAQPPASRVMAPAPAPAPLPPTPALLPELAAPASADSSPRAPTAVATVPAPVPATTAPVAAAPVAVAAAPQAAAEQRPPAPPRVELPSSDADYLQNPKPVYPPMSKRLGEQGTVLVRVLIGADGTAQKAEIQQSSNFARLDQAALATVLQWRYVPGTRGGVAQAMWSTVPIAWVLN